MAEPLMAPPPEGLAGSWQKKIEGTAGNPFAEEVSGGAFVTQALVLPRKAAHHLMAGRGAYRQGPAST